MTAEVAVLNKMGLALAADSAVTIGADKVYKSANKLFTLSKVNPVGIMVYGNAEFMGVPWETIIKAYRKILSSKTFDHLDGYANDFFEYLKQTAIFSDEIESDYVVTIIKAYLETLKEEIINEVQKVIDEKSSITKSEVSLTVNKVIKNHFDEWEGYPRLKHFPDNFEVDFIQKFDSQIIEQINAVFEKIKLSKQSYVNLKSLLCGLFSKARFHDGISGVVIAGFGELDVFPRLQAFDVDCRVLGHVKFQEDSNRATTITERDTACIVPFAQSEMVHTFMRGIDPSQYSIIREYLGGLFNQYPKLIVDKLKLSASESKKVLSEIQKETSFLYEDFKKYTDGYQNENHVSPILDMVAVLPKDELASMAEALVNLTSFKRKVTAVAETVGGPVDVAVISKGDGFIWIKRKHYFSVDMNRHFIKNYFREVEEDE